VAVVVMVQKGKQSPGAEIDEMAPGAQHK